MTLTYSLAGRYRSHAPERCIFLNNIFGSPKGSIYQIFMFPARNIFSMVFLAAILAAILDFQRPSWICINQHNFKTNYHRETNDTNFSWYFDTTNPFAMLFLGFGQHFLGNGCHGDENTANFEKCLYTFSSWKCTIYKYMLYGHYMSHIICLIYFVIILDVDKAPTNAVGLHYHGNHYLKHLIKFHKSAITLKRNIVQRQITTTFRGTLLRPVQLQCCLLWFGYNFLSNGCHGDKIQEIQKKLVYVQFIMHHFL